MIRHFFLDKTNTIIKDRRQNFGLNPILSVGYGNGVMRGLIHFDMDEIKTLVKDKTFANVDKLKFTLKMTNCFSVAGVPYESELNRGKNQTAKRAASCDLMIFKLPCHFDAGRGFDYIDDLWIHDVRSFSIEGSTWYQSKSNIPWSIEYSEDYDPKKDEGGIYKFSELKEAYEKYLNGEDSIVITTQHFDFGNEALSMDITKYVIECLNGKDNFGLCLSFIPSLENKNREELQVLDFFTDHTNTFFHPYIEIEYDEQILDNRDSFVLGNTNRLYLYVYDDGILTNLDNVPVCKIDEIDYPVVQSSKGVYYAEITGDFNKGMMYYDTWSNLVLNGVELDDVEMEFVVNDNLHNRTIGNKSSIKQRVSPIVYGINDGENISQDEIREISVEFQEKYSGTQVISKKALYRLYVKDGDREIDVIPFRPLEMAYLNNFFTIHTQDLIPNKYFIDIRVGVGRELMTFKDVLHFNIVSNVTERYQ